MPYIPDQPAAATQCQCLLAFPRSASGARRVLLAAGASRLSQKIFKKSVDREGSMWYYSKAVENGREKEETREGKT